jgi:hypothetical protein
MPAHADVRTLRVSSLQSFKPQGADQRNGRLARVDRLLLTFDLDADLTGTFNWNVKQLFVYLTATFSTPANVRAPAAPRPPRVVAAAPRRHALPPFAAPPPHNVRACRLQELNRVVVWDRVVARPEDAHLVATGNFSKYPILDQRAELRGRLVNLTLSWDIMPYTGLLFTGSGGRYAARLPDAYCEGDAAATCAFSDVLEETRR